MSYATDRCSVGQSSSAIRFVVSVASALQNESTELERTTHSPCLASPEQLIFKRYAVQTAGAISNGEDYEPDALGAILGLAGSVAEDAIK